MYIFPEWSDLGMAEASNSIKSTWESEISRSWRYQWYFDGLVFDEKINDEALPQNEQPLLFPVGINLVKMLTIAHADATFGEWDERPITFSVRKDLEPTEDDRKAIQFLNYVFDASFSQSLFWELELERQIYGGGAIRIAPRPTDPERFKLFRTPKYNFYPIWDPDDPDRLLETYIITTMTSEQAKAKYGITSTADLTNRVEHWTLREYETFIDQQPVVGESGANPYNIVPFHYFPRFRSTNWFGDSLTQDIMQVQDDLNLRLADIGEALNYNSHPIRWGLNMPRSFDSNNFPLGNNAFWDFGRALPNAPKPEVGLLQVQNPVPQGAFDYVTFLYDWSRTSSFAPPIAFGEDNGGGQRSGITLEIRMWPLIKSVRRSRSYLTVGITQVLKIIGMMMRQKRLPNVTTGMIDSILQDRIVPQFAPVMPRDQAAIVDEVVKLLSTNPPSISLETTQSLLGRGPAEVMRIIAMLSDDRLWKRISDAVAGDEEENTKEDKTNDNAKKDSVSD